RGETTVIAPGINAKMNEVQAAMGLLQLKHIDRNIEKRRQITIQYREQLKDIPGITCINDLPGVKHCYSYFPVFVDQEKYGLSRDALYDKLKQHNIYGRRYFYPLISQFSAYRNLESALHGKLPVAETITEKVICLPLYPELELLSVEDICNILHQA
ncbi:MAG: DegT/DnrJ/EryC1/StrS family aminotransferase, partial [Bacteroidales bacterium]|nr:DegT/DnrJ/EryC1/StrS family aminotransferase [Bacteroidales bacterium]